MRFKLTCSINELCVILGCEQGVGEIPEELLHETRNTVDIMVKVLGICEIDL